MVQRSVESCLSVSMTTSRWIGLYRQSSIGYLWCLNDTPPPPQKKKSPQKRLNLKIRNQFPVYKKTLTKNIPLYIYKPIHSVHFKCDPHPRPPLL